MFGKYKLRIREWQLLIRELVLLSSQFTVSLKSEAGVKTCSGNSKANFTNWMSSWFLTK